MPLPHTSTSFNFCVMN